MPKKIKWKKGMRLTDEILRASDESQIQMVGQALLLAAGGKMGLLPSSQPFEVSVNVAKGFVDVESLTCLAITRDGSLVDIHYDTRYTNTQETRVAFAESEGVKEMILAVEVRKGEWHEVADGFEEPDFGFLLLMPNTPVPDNAFPIARIVENPYTGWGVDDTEFVPPCLLLSSHRRLQELRDQVADRLAVADQKALLASMGNRMARDVMRIFWPDVRRLMVKVDKERDTMTPMELLAVIQQIIGDFVIACRLTDDIDINEEDAELFNQYVKAPYNYKDVCKRIQEGLGMTLSINSKIDAIIAAAPKQEPRREQPQPQPQPSEPEEIPAPYITDENLTVTCKNNNTQIPIVNPAKKSTVTFTIDGSEPTGRSARATKNDTLISFPNTFKTTGKEPDKNITVKLCAFAGNERSRVATFEVTLVKSLKFRDGIPVI